MNDRTYKCASAKAVCNKIWNADFYLESFNDIVESGNPDTVIATVGKSGYLGPDGRVSLVATLHDHPWSPTVFECLIDWILGCEDTLDEWSAAKGSNNWTVTLKWRD